jgi:hypothetical protein
LGKLVKVEGCSSIEMKKLVGFPLASFTLGSGNAERMTIGGRRTIMARLLTVLVALVAQGMALMSPVCLVRCVSPSGQQCVELVSQDCRCDGCPSHESQPQEVCAVAQCCDKCHDHDEEQEAPAGPQIASQGCSCHRTSMESAPQVQNKSLASDVLLVWHDVLMAPTMMSVVADIHALKDPSLRLSLLRPHESPHLAMLATVVLRV